MTGLFIFEYKYLLLAVLICFLKNEIHEGQNQVLAAPQKNNEQKVTDKLEGTPRLQDNVTSKVGLDLDGHKTADLTILINETLKINNKSAVTNPSLTASSEQPNFRDDWTFDRVEYDLMDFLQELNARYRYTNKSHQVGEDSLLKERQDFDSALKQSTQTLINNSQEAQKVTPSTVSQVVQETVTKTTIEAVKKELDALASTPASIEKRVDLEPHAVFSATVSSILPISLASNDHDISESSWQYGIFDRFTRPKPSSTTQSPDNLLASGTNANLDVRSFNSDECGLRTYRAEPDYSPVAALGASDTDTDEMTKELSQRRQRPPLGSFFSSHKKYHHTGANGDVLAEGDADELTRDRPLDSLPPFDRYGEPALATSGGNAANPSSATTNESQVDRIPAQAPDNEFNLALRRQWLQQQLGSTLQMLGLNTSGNHQSLSDYFNRSVPMRENMMKMSASRNNKVGKSVKPDEFKKVQLGSGETDLIEQELRARQDELKLEARVIGGNDARLGDSPWSVSLQALVSRPGTGGVEYRHYCGGTIISENYILTAAHCLDFMVGRESRLFVVVGDLNWRMSAASVYGRRFGIEKLIIHGGYKSTAFGHDIGLIRTKESMKPLKVNGRYIVNSVCLPEKNVEHTGEAELVGWGLFSNRNEMADSLQIADVPILPRPLCVDLYRRRTGLIQWLIGIELITEKQICAGTFGRGICQGDSGSALVFNEKTSVSPNDRAPSATPNSNTRVRSNLLRDQQQRATIIGVVAFGGIRRCSYQSLPGVYMQTSKYLDWILPRIQ